MIWFNVAHIKNCEPLVSFPRLAMDKRKALSCLRTKFSSVGAEIEVWTSQRLFPHTSGDILREELDKGENVLNHCLSNLPLKFKWLHVAIISTFVTSRLP